MAANSRVVSEPAIFVEYVQSQGEYSYTDDGTPVERKPIRPELVWINFDDIERQVPGIDFLPKPAPWPGTLPDSLLVRGILNEPLTQSRDSPYIFRTTPASRLSEVLPGNLQGGIYRAELRTALGETIPYDPSVWVADGSENVICFKYKSPAELGYSPPLNITYWRYTGAVSAGPLAFANKGPGAQVYDSGEASSAGLASLRSLVGAEDGLAVVQGEDAITISNTLAGANLGPGVGVYSGKAGASLGFRSLVAGKNIVLVQNPEEVTISAVGEGSTLIVTNEGGGAQIYDAAASTSISAFLRTLTSAGDGLTVTQGEGTIVIGNTLTGSNLGDGAQLFSGKSGGSLGFRSLLAGANSGLTLAQAEDAITIAATSGAVVTSVANGGEGVQVYDSAASEGSSVVLRTFAGTGNGLTLTQGEGTIVIDNTLTGSNLGGGSQLFLDKSGETLRFRSLLADANSGLALTQAENVITIAAASGAVVTSVSNGGEGAQVYNDQASGGSSVVLRSFAGTKNGLAVTQEEGAIVIDNTLTGSNLGEGAQLFSDKFEDTLRFRSLLADASSGLTLTQGEGAITIAATSGAVVTSVTNGGEGAQVYDASASQGTSVALRTLAGTHNGLTVVQGEGEITIDNTLTGLNLGEGSQLFLDKLGDALRFRSLLADENSGLVLTQVEDAITIAAASGAVVTSVSNGGEGAQVYDAAASGGSSAVLRSFAGTKNGLTVTQEEGTIVVDNTLTGSNLGEGSQLFLDKSGDALRFRSLLADANSGLALTQAEEVITIAAASGAVITSITNGGEGAQVYNAAASQGSSVALRTLAGTNNGLTITQGEGEITIDNTLTGAGLGGGYQLFLDKSNDRLRFRSLLAGGGLSLTQDEDTITIGTPSGTVITSVANEGEGAQVYNDATGGGASVTLRTFAGTKNGLSVVQEEGSIIIDNTLAGANLGEGAQLYSDKAGDSLRFRTLLAETSCGLTLTQAENVITIAATSGNVVTAVINEGKGAQVYDEKASGGSSVVLRTLVGTDSGLKLSQDETSVIIDNTLTGVNRGKGAQVFAEKTGEALGFRSIVAGSNVAVTQEGDEITIAALATGAVTSISNEGLGAQVYNTTNSTPTSALFRSLLGSANGLAVTQGAAAVTIDNTLTGANLGAGAQLFSAKVGAALNFRSLLGSANGLTVTQGGTGITIDNTLTGASLGAGAAVFSAKSGAELRFNSLAGTANGLAISAPAAGLITIDNTLTGANLGAGSQLFSAKAGAALNFRSLVAAANSGLTLTQGATAITLSATNGAVVTSIANEDAGAQVYNTATSAGSSVLLRSLLGSANGLTVTQGATAITIDNTLTGANLGAGSQLFSAKAGAALNFRSLVAAANSGLTLTQGATAITLSAINGAVVTSIANEDVGAQVYNTTTSAGSSVLLRSLLGSANGLTVTQGATAITIDNTLTGANLGAGSQLFSAKAGAALNFRSLVAGANISLAQSASNITISASVTGITNAGAGSLIYDTNNSTATAAILRSLLGTANGLTVAQGATTITIDNTLTGANLGAGSQLFSAKAGAALNFRSLIAGTNVALVQGLDDITISAAATGITNAGAGSPIYDTVNSTATAAILRSLLGTANGLAVTQEATTITIDNTLTGANLGTGSQLFSAKAGAALNFRSLVAGTNVALVQGLDDITISAAVTGITNAGAGSLIYDAVNSTATAAILRSLLGTANGLTVTQGTAAITIDNTLSGANLGAGSQLFSDKVGAALNFRTLVAGANVTLTQGVSDITISAAASLSIANAGAGSLIYDTVNSTATSAILRSLLGTANGLTVTQGAAAITIDNTLTGANLGAGSQLFSAKAGAALNFRTLVAAASSGLTLAQGETTITISAASGNVITSIANEGGGAQIYDTVTSGGSSALLRSLLGTANGLTVTQGATAITIDNTLTGANLGAGSQLFSAKAGAALNFRSLVAAASSGLALTQGESTITIGAATGAVVTGIANEGAGAQVYDVTTSTPSSAVFRSLVAGSNITLAQNANNITISAAVTGAVTSIANEGGGAQVYNTTTSTAPAAQLRTLLGTGNGAVVTQSATTITIDNTLTGGNLGEGAQVFSDKTGAALNFRSIVAGSGIIITQNPTNITIDNSACGGDDDEGYSTPWLISDVKSNSSNGGSSLSNKTQTRTLNTIVSSAKKPLNVVLVANTIVFAPGRYYVEGRAPAYNVLSHRASLVLALDGAPVIQGSSACAGAATTTDSIFRGYISPSATTAYRVDHYTKNQTSGSGLGIAVGQGSGYSEVYTTVVVYQIA